MQTDFDREVLAIAKKYNGPQLTKARRDVAEYVHNNPQAGVQEFIEAVGKLHSGWSKKAALRAFADVKESGPTKAGIAPGSKPTTALGRYAASQYSKMASRESNESNVYNTGLPEVGPFGGKFAVPTGKESVQAMKKGARGVTYGTLNNVGVDLKMKPGSYDTGSYALGNVVVGPALLAAGGEAVGGALAGSAKLAKYAPKAAKAAKALYGANKAGKAVNVGKEAIKGAARGAIDVGVPSVSIGTPIAAATEGKKGVKEQLQRTALNTAGGVILGGAGGAIAGKLAANSKFVSDRLKHLSKVAGRTLTKEDIPMLKQGGYLDGNLKPAKLEELAQLNPQYQQYKKAMVNSVPKANTVSQGALPQPTPKQPIVLPEVPQGRNIDAPVSGLKQRPAASVRIGNPAPKAVIPEALPKDVRYGPAAPKPVLPEVLPKPEPYFGDFVEHPTLGKGIIKRDRQGQPYVLAGKGKNTAKHQLDASWQVVRQNATGRPVETVTPVVEAPVVPETGVVAPNTDIPYQPKTDVIDGVKIYTHPKADGTEAWLVQQADNKGTDRVFGDTIHSTKEEAIQEAQLLTKREASKIEQTRLEAESKAKEAELKAIADDIDGFGDSDTPIVRGRKIQALNKQINYKNNPVSRKEFLRARVAEGGVVKNDTNQGRILEMPDGRYWNQGDMTKTGIDYAEHLQTKSPQMDTPLPAKVAQLPEDKVVSETAKGNGILPGNQKGFVGLKPKRTLTSEEFAARQEELFSTPPQDARPYTPTPEPIAPIEAPIEQPMEQTGTGVADVPQEPTDSVAGAYKAFIEPNREARGVAPVEQQAYTLPQQAYERGQAAVESRRIDPGIIAREVADRPRQLNPEEVGALAYDQARISNARIQAENEVVRLQDAGDMAGAEQAKIQADSLAEQLNTNETALRHGGREMSAAFRALGLGVKEDYSIDSLIRRARVKEGRPLTIEEQTTITNEATEYAKLQAEYKAYQVEKEAAIAKLKEQAKTNGGSQFTAKVRNPNNPAYGSTNKIITQERLAAAEARLSAKLSRLNAGIDPLVVADVAEIIGFHIEAAGRMSFNKLHMILRSKYPKLDSETIKAAYLQATNDKAIERSTRITQQAIKETEELLAAKVGRGRPVRNIDDVGLSEIKAQLMAKRAKLDAMTKTSPPMSTWDIVTEYANIPRSLKTMADLGHMFRQGSKLMVGENKQWRDASLKSMKLLFSDKTLGLTQALRQDNKNYGKALQSGVWESSLDAVRDVGKKEEWYAGAGPLEKIPLLGNAVRAGGRSFTEFGNTLRFETFYKYVEQYGDTMTPKDYEALANFLNRATGRGNLMGLEKSARTVSAAFFAPRYAISQIQTPLYMASSSPLARKVAAKNMAGYIGAQVAFLGMLKAAGAEVGLDPASPDFGKAKFGNTRFDIWGGGQNNIRQIHQFSKAIYQRITGVAPGDKQVNPEYMALRYVRGKASPTLGLAWSAMMGKNYVGEEFSTANASTIAQNELLPLFVQDVEDAWRDGGWEKAAVVAPLTFFGISANTYKTKPKNKYAR